MYRIRKQFRFSMAHQLYSCFSECCKNAIHGHEYVLEVFFESKELNKDGMIIDFGEVKFLMDDYVDSWDHALVMPDSFPEEYLNSLKKFNKKIKIVNYNPSAENMAKDMYAKFKKHIPQTCKVRLHETTTGYAEYYE